MVSKKGREFESQLDWYYISRHTLTKVIAGFVILAGLVAGGTWLFFYLRDDSAVQKANAAILEAEKALTDVRAMPDVTRYAEEIAQIDKLINDARSAFTTGDNSGATRRAVDAQSLARNLVGGKVSKADANIVDFAGDVKIQRANQTTWQPPKTNVGLRDGDFIKTGPNGTAEVMSADGTLYRIKPETLFEVHATKSLASGDKQSEAKFIVGNVDINTGEGGSSRVLTDAAQADIKGNSSVGMDSEGGKTGVSTFKGSTVLSNKSGQSVTLGERERAVATKDGGGISAKVKLPESPAPLLPEDNTLFDFKKREPIALRWAAIKDARGYVLQIAHSRLFVPDSIVTDDPHRLQPEALINVTEEGSFYWRVKALGKTNVESEWSPVRRFKVLAGGQAQVARAGEKVAPDLVIQRPQVIGNQVIIQGRTEPGAAVTVGSSAGTEPADPDINGNFRKIITLGDGFNQIKVRAVNSAGLETIRTENVIIQNW
jgi:FecR protein